MDSLAYQFFMTINKYVYLMCWMVIVVSCPDVWPIHWRASCFFFFLLSFFFKIFASLSFYSYILGKKCLWSPENTQEVLFCSSWFTRFSQFFVSPLMKIEAMEREALAVDSGAFSLPKCVFNFLFIKIDHFSIIWRCILILLSIHSCCWLVHAWNKMDIEFNQVLQNDACRLQQLQCHTSKPGYPFNRFFWGRFASLTFHFRIHVPECVKL